MQDRFSFRVWKSQEHRMVYNVCYLNPLLLDEEKSEEGKYNKLLQCTGIKDENGNLIYEGDIVKTWKFSTGEISNKVVIWNKDRCGFRLYTIDQYKRNIHNSPQSMLNVTTIKLLGNIYENPELLEEESIC